MSKKTFTIQQLMDWCDKHHQEDKSLVMKWEGGGDSGWVYFELDEEQCNEPEAEQLVDMMYDQLDYGSWAGEFSANGEAEWDPKKKAFIGTDYYSETESTSTKTENIEVRIPKYIPFDEVRINMQEEDDITVEIMILNGFVHPEIVTVERKLEETLQKKIDDAIDAAVKENNEELEGRYGDYHFRLAEFKEDGKDMVAIIDEVQYTIHTGEDKYIEINLLELLEEEA